MVTEYCWLIVLGCLLAISTFVPVDASGTSIIQTPVNSANVDLVYFCNEEDRYSCEIDARSDYVSDGHHQGSCIAVRKRCCVATTGNSNCCNDISEWNVIEVCFHYSKGSLPKEVVCRQSRKRLERTHQINSEGQRSTVMQATIPRHAKNIALYWSWTNPLNSSKLFVKTAAHGRFEITGRESVRHGLVEYKTSVVRGNQTVSVTNKIPRAINFTIMGTRSLVYFYQEDPPRDEPYGAGFAECTRLFGSFFEWNFESAPETDCTERCGQGWRIKRAVCVYKGSSTRGNFCCGLPPVLAQKCHRVACKPNWHLGPYGKCQSTCGRSQKSREVICTQEISDVLQKEVNHTSCNISTRPSTTKPCVGLQCTEKWTAGEWGQCESYCAPAVRRRKYKCTSLTGSVLNDSACSGQVKPNDTQPCGNPCTSKWELRTNWTECIGVCGDDPGMKYRTVACVILYLDGTIQDSNAHHNYCDPTTKYPDAQTCSLNCSYWKIVSSEPCSNKCGEGYISRDVRCFDNSGKPSHACSEENRPDSHIKCHGSQCSGKRSIRFRRAIKMHQNLQERDCKNSAGVNCDKRIAKSL